MARTTLAKRTRTSTFSFSGARIRVTVSRTGEQRRDLSDVYLHLLTMPWPVFLLLIVLALVIANALFAAAYMIGGGVAHARHGSFADLFFFSVQTMATIGYGRLEPESLLANALVGIEAFAGLVALAMVTGLTFARFSRPDARVRFSRVAIIALREGVPTLMFRMANQRGSGIVEANIHVVFTRDEVTSDGERIRRFYDLPVQRARSALFVLSWTAIHVIDESSPLHGLTPESLAAAQGAVIVSVTGIEEAFSQTVHSRYSWMAERILWNVRFVDILQYQEDGSVQIDYSVFDDVAPLARIDPELESKTKLEIAPGDGAPNDRRIA